MKQEQVPTVAVLLGQECPSTRQRRVGAQGCPGTDGRHLLGEALWRREVREGGIPPVRARVV
eukprot:8381566-Pyramimonas_sp.AAC.1